MISHNVENCIDCLQLEAELTEAIKELQAAKDEIKRLQELADMCQCFDRKESQ